MLHRKLLKLFPDWQLNDWIIVDDGDGQRVLKWNRPEPQPTQEELDAISELSVIKTLKTPLVTQERNNALLTLTCSWDGDTWDADEDSSNRIANALSMIREAKELGIPTPTSISWRTADNKDRILTIAELTQMGASVFLAQQVVWGKQAQLKNAIEAATTKEELEKIEW